MEYWDRIKTIIRGENKRAPIPGMNSKTSLILLLLKMAEIDGKIDQFEQNHIQFLSNTIGVDRKMVDKYRNRLNEVVLIVPESRKEKVDYFWRLLTVMKIDLYADPKELVMCRDMGKALGFKKAEYEKGIEYMQENIMREVDLKEFSEVMEEA